MTTAHSIFRDRSGTAMVEFTIIFMLLMLLTGGIVDFGNLLYQWNSAEKATQAGARAAAISDPVATELATFDCDNNSITLGTPCRNGGTSFGTIVCNGATSTCSGGKTFSATALGLILTPMQKMFPRLQAQNVIVEYTDVGLGFAGRQAPVPEIRVRLTGLTFDYAFLGSLLGFPSITMPDFRATLVGEDLSSAGA
ncbi:MAG: TadE/TadG family type IV pilus assembly protein [Alphaproteobacteria bacterium]